MVMNLSVPVEYLDQTSDYQLLTMTAPEICFSEYGNEFHDDLRK
jgi:hypothetical protein